MDLIANGMKANTLYSLNKGLPADLNSLERIEAMAAYRIKLKILKITKALKTIVYK